MKFVTECIDGREVFAREFDKANPYAYRWQDDGKVVGGSAALGLDALFRKREFDASDDKRAQVDAARAFNLSLASSHIAKIQEEVDLTDKLGTVILEALDNQAAHLRAAKTSIAEAIRLLETLREKASE